MNYDRWPKVQLHLHLDGSFRLSTLWELATSAHIHLPGDGTLKGYEAYIRRCRQAESVNDYLKMFADPLRLMQTSANLSRFSYELIEDLVAQKHIYAEIRFAPQLHTMEGLSQEEALQAVLKGKAAAEKKYPTIHTGIICCMMSVGSEKSNWEENQETIRLCQRYLGKGVVGLDLAGAEGIVPLANFGGLFAQANTYGLPLTCHAGDSVGSDTMQNALDFGVHRVGHGHHIYESEDLCAIFALHQICLEICPTSNIQCKTQKSYAQHPAKKLFDMGIPLNLSTDNMTLAGVTLAEEYHHAVAEMGFTNQDIWQMNIMGIRHSFADEKTKIHVLHQLYQAMKEEGFYEISTYSVR